MNNIIQQKPHFVELIELFKKRVNLRLKLVYDFAFAYDSSLTRTHN